MHRVLITTALATLLAACGGSNGQAQSNAGAPVASKPANAPDQKPAFAGQTRAPEVKSNVALQVTTVAEGLEMPWGLAFLPDGRLLISEKHIGQLRILALREKAKAALGPKFDIKEFHEVVLKDGALPLGVLEEQVDAYIASKKAG